MERGRNFDAQVQADLEWLLNLRRALIADPCVDKREFIRSAKFTHVNGEWFEDFRFKTGRWERKLLQMYGYPIDT